MAQEYKFEPRRAGKSVAHALAFVAELRSIKLDEEVIITRLDCGALIGKKRPKQNEPGRDRASDIFTGDMLADHY